ncbi:PKD domain-containing protein, partial [Caldiplasma sukawensis]
MKKYECEKIKRIKFNKFNITSVLAVFFVIILIVSSFAGNQNMKPEKSFVIGKHYNHAQVDVKESGLSSEINSWSATVYYETKSTSPGHELAWSFEFCGDTFTVSVSFNSVPGYSSPASSRLTLSDGEVKCVVGSYSGAPLPPTISGISSSNNPLNNAGNYTTLTANVNFEDVAGDEYHWSATGGSFSSTSASSPTWTSSTSGTYTISLYVSSDAGESSTVSLSQQAIILKLNVSSTPQISDSGQSVTFSSAVSGNMEGSLSYSYILYDGNSSSDPHLASGTTSEFSYDFTSSGSFLLNYSVVDSDSSGKASAFVDVLHNVNSDTSVTISSSQNPTDSGKTVEFTSSVSGGTPGYSYSWSVDGNTYTTHDINVSFSSSGSYSVELTVSDAAGYSVSQSLTEIVNSDPTVSASANVSSADVGYPIEFSSSPSGGTGPYTYSWIIGGSQVSTSQDFSYSFSTAGTYTVEVTITDSVGETYSAWVTVTIINNPSVSVTSSQNPTDVGNSVTFTASESGGTGTISYAWTINGASEGSGSTLDYSFSSSGTYTVEITVTDSDGHTATASITETVYLDPSVSISSSQNPTDVGNSVTFTASPSGGSGSYTYQWYENNAQISGATSSTYTTSFSSPGTYDFYVIIHDSVGNSAQSSTLDQSVNVDPSVSISSSQNPTDVGNSVTFTASGSGGTGSFSYTWYVNGATQSSTSSTLSYTFSSAGAYYVNVTVKD